MSDVLPPWFVPWCAGTLDLAPAVIRSIVDLGRRSEKDRAFVLRYPPGAVVRCLCGESACVGYGIVVHMGTSPEQHLTLAASPAGRARRTTVTPAMAEPVGYAGAWTPATVGLLLDGEEAGG